MPALKLGDDRPLVSVVTPAYNEATRGFFTDTLSSVSQQNYEPIEHVVVDDGSTDDTASLVEEFDHSHDLQLLQQENLGMTRAVNNGLKCTEGRVVVWLNADDVLPKRTTVERIVAAFQRDPSPDVVYGYHAFLDPDGTIDRVKVPHPRTTQRRLLLSNYGVMVFLDGEMFRSLELNPEYEHLSDYELYLRAIEHEASFAHVNDLLYGHRVHGERKTALASEEMDAEGKRLRSAYGADEIRWFELQQRLIGLQIDALQAAGLRTMVEIARHPDRFVDGVQIDSLNRGLRRQLRACTPG